MANEDPRADGHPPAPAPSLPGGEERSETGIGQEVNRVQALPADAPLDQDPPEASALDEARARLAAHPEVDASGLTLSAEGPTLFLTGTVGSEEIRRQILALLADLPGVHQIRDRSELRPTAGNESTPSTTGDIGAYLDPAATRSEPGRSGY